MGRRYAILDVFTNKALAGNPLAVVLDSEGLSDEQMQAIAGEFHLSETVFVLPPENPGHSANIRIFTPSKELPFAGHPTVGTAICLAMERFGEVSGEQDAMVVLKEQIGPVRCGVVLKENAAGFAEFDLPKLPAPAGPTEEKDLISGALGLDPVDIGFENHGPSSYEAGVPYVFVPVNGLEALSRATPNHGLWSQAFKESCSTSVFVYCRETTGHDSGFQARMFAPDMGIGEDPATGSAVAAFAGAIHYFDELPNGTHFIRIEQGFVMGRPSHIDLEIDVEAKKLKAVRIGGQATLVARGELFV